MAAPAHTSELRFTRLGEGVLRIGGATVWAAGGAEHEDIP